MVRRLAGAAVGAAGGWWRAGVIYQIYPRSFLDSNGDGVGDLDGITARLDHLNDGSPGSLGVDAVWLSPIYPSPGIDCGYDVADYCDVDPVFGDLAAFDRLVQAAHRRGIRVILDFVPNHTSDQHPWFVESRSSRDNPKRDWYIWSDPRPDGAPPNNWLSAFHYRDSAWTLDPATGQCYLHSFAPEQPDLNWRNPAVRQAMHDVLRFWLDRGVDGFRIDVAHRLVKDAHLRDNHPDVAHLRRDLEPHEQPLRNMDQAETHEVLRGFREIVDAYGDRVLIGEVGISDLGRMLRYHGENGDELDLCFYFRFWAEPWRAEAFRAAVDAIEGEIPALARASYVLSNHDISRSASRFDAERHPGRARVAAMMLLTLKGTPFLYYGEEIGMRDLEIPAERTQDPAGRDPVRTPMQWEASHLAGFSSRTPWLPVPAELGPGDTVAGQSADRGSLLALHRKLIWYRRGSTALLTGCYQSLPAAPDVFMFVRATGQERLLVALNFADEPRAADLAPHVGAAASLELSTDVDRQLGALESERLELRPSEGVIVRL